MTGSFKPFSAAGLALALAVVLGGGACKTRVPVVTEPFTDDFERVDIGPQWLNTGAEYRIVGGKLNVSEARNHPLWLRQKLPESVIVDVDVMSKSPDGDLKVELYGDGESFDSDQGRYDPTGYIFVFGGWQNSLSIIGKLGEHDAAVKAKRADIKVKPGQTYHWTIVKRGGYVDWTIDGRPFLTYFDPKPLSGQGHDFFAINDWQSDIYFDNLRIRPTN